MAWEQKTGFKGRFTKERMQEAISILSWGYQQLTPSYQRYIFVHALLHIVPIFVGLLSALLLRGIVNAAVNHEATLFYRTIGIYIIVSVINLIYNALVGYFSTRTNKRMVLEMHKYFYRIILKKEYGAMEMFRTGELLHRFQSDIPNICSLLIQIPSTFLSLIIQLVGSTYLIFTNVPEIGIVSIPIILFVTISNYTINQKIQKYAKISWKKKSHTTSIVIEHIRNLMLFHTFGKEEYSYQRVSEALDSQLETEFDIHRISTIFSNAFNLMMLFISVGGMYYFLSKVLNVEMNIGTYTMLMALVDRLKAQVATMSGLIPTIFNLLLSSERAQEIDQSEDDMMREPIPEEIIKEFYENELDSLGFRDVTFGYGKHERGLVLENFNLDIKKGEFIATTGLSGCGKSTMQKIMLGLYRPNSGELYLRKKDGTEEKLDSAWRALFSYVPQQNFLFHGTIKEIVEFGVPDTDPNQKRIWDALKIACADEFVKELPEGLETEVKENGGGLSEGQIQRLAIARAIYTDRPILLLDECTSSLDGETERKTLENIKSMTDKTVIIVTHRPAALEYCDREVRFLSREEKKKLAQEAIAAS